MVNILVTEPEYFNEDAMKILRETGEVKATRLTKEQLLNEVKDVDALVVRIETHLSKEVLERAKKLKVIGSATTGLNHIDTDYAKERGIKVINLQGAHTFATAEHAFALMLSFYRRIPWAHEHLKKGGWDRHKFIGNSLKGKTLGILGYGRIGRKLSEFAKAFGMDIIAFDPYVKTDEVKLVSFEELLKNSDVITIHAMLTKETEKMINYDSLKMMKKNAILINTARAGIVDVHALLRALKENLIYGAALDVFSNEPITNEEKHILEHAEQNHNLLITPHIAASTHEAAQEAGVEIALKIKECFKQ
ncbi:MAG TPA: hydroxyacid dehydrogenase [archaeon]|nr:hydroxyacid dehydrogenase [archaeon]